MFFSIFSLILLAAPTLDSDMTREEKKETGVSKLSRKEKKALQAWIDAHFNGNEEAQGIPTPTSIKAAPKRPVVEEVIQNGRYVKLSDQTSWEIYPADTIITQAWLSPSDILITQSGNGEYPYTLTNSQTGSSVRARKINQIPSPSSQKPQQPAAPAPQAPPAQKPGQVKSMPLNPPAPPQKTSSVQKP